MPDSGTWPDLFWGAFSAWIIVALIISWQEFDNWRKNKQQRMHHPKTMQTVDQRAEARKPIVEEATEDRPPIELSIDLAGRLFSVATEGMRNFGKPLLGQWGIDGDVFRRLELEGLCLRLFTARTAFIRATDQGNKHNTRVLDYFDDLVRWHFDKNPEGAAIYLERCKAYQLALEGPAANEEWQEAWEEALGREYSRLTGWTGPAAIPIGAAQAAAMITTVKESVIDYASHPERVLIDEMQAGV